MFPGSPGTFLIKESFKKWDKTTYDKAYREKSEHERADYPLGDFLGPAVLVWSEDEAAILTTDSGKLIEVPKSKSQRAVLALLIDKPPFTTRVSAMPVTRSLVAEYIQGLRGGDNTPWMKSLDTDGEVTVEFEESDPSGKKYREVLDGILEDDGYVAITNIPISWKPKDQQKPSAKAMNMEFRYPPIPLQDGFNIFGPIGFLGLSSARGTVSIRSQAINIPAPSKLEMEGIAGLKVGGGVFTIPIQTKGNEITFEISAVRRISLNDDLKNQWGEVHGIGSRLQFVILICTIAQGLVALVVISSMFVRKSRLDVEKQFAKRRSKKLGH